MARISGFIAGVIGIIAGVLQLIIFKVVFDGEADFLELIEYALLSSNDITAAMFIMISFIALILMFIILMVTKKKTIILGSLAGIAATVLNMLGWNITGQFFMNYIAAPIWAVSALLFFLGAIAMRKEGKMSILSGLILLGIVIGGQIVILMVILGPYFMNGNFITTYNRYSEFRDMVEIYLMLILGQSFALGLHGIFIGFSRKKGAGEDDETEDTMSVDSQSAFTSYVDDKPKKQKKEKKKKSEEVEFTF